MRIMLAAILVFASTFSFCGPGQPIGNHFFEGLEIDNELHLNSIGSDSLLPPALRTYYSFFYTATDMTTVNHFEKKEDGTLEHLLYLETQTNPVIKERVLWRTVKTDEILSKPFGTVYAKKQCGNAWWPPRANRTTPAICNCENSVLVGDSSANRRWGESLGESPAQLSTAPKHLPELTSGTLVRMFGAGTEHLWISADYEPSGQLVRWSIGQTTESGERVPGTEQTTIDLNDKRLGEYGIPARIDLRSSPRSRRFAIPVVRLPQEQSIVYIHYGFGKVIQENTLLNGVVTSSRFLQPSVTEEERFLNSWCDSRMRATDK